METREFNIKMFGKDTQGIDEKMLENIIQEGFSKYKYNEINFGVHWISKHKELEEEKK